MSPLHRYRRKLRLARAALGVLTTVLASAPSSSVLAGDILRGGSTAGSGRSTTAVAGNPTAAATLPNLNARDSLSRTTQALQAMRTMQDAARATAKGGPANLGANPLLPSQTLPNVPNGLVTGGLKLAPGVPADLAHPTTTENPALWTGANLPTQTTAASGQTNVNIVQTNQQALLNWQTFNVGKETTVNFDQTAGGANATQWIAFNKVNDPSGVPSQILGNLSGIGQVYVINANGILFGGSSQVNLHTLVASAVPINDNLIARGLLNNPDNQFLFSALALPSGANGTPAFVPPPSNTPDGRYGDVTVQAGATLTSPTSADNVGGRIALFGANVRNDGTISTPDGQTILAAGLQIGLVAHSTNDPSLRGLDVYVGNTSPYGGIATNNGLIDAPRADVTMAGSRVNQLGFINATTSVAANGRIDLLANYNAVGNTNTQQPNPPPFLFQSAGQVTLGPDSVTQVVPEYDSTQRVVGTSLALTSQVNIQGLTIHQAGNALLFAPSGTVNLAAGTFVFYEPDGTPLSAQSQFVSSAGQVYLDAGAIIDVSGSKNVSAPVSENVVAAQLLGPELANSPLQRNGPLRGQTVYVDITKTGTYDGQPYVGTPLADVSGYVNLVQRTVGELTTAGGTVSLSAGNSVVLQTGSLIDVSGGYINFTGSMVHTTQVMAGGSVFDISQATPDRVYSGIMGRFMTDHPKYGISETTTNPLNGSMQFEAGFTQGFSGGTLQITAPSMALDGQFLASTVTGEHQTTTPPNASALATISPATFLATTPPAAGSLALIFQAQQPTPSSSFLTYSPTPPSITFANGAQSAVAPFALDAVSLPLPLTDDRRQNVFLSPDLINTDGFGKLTVNNSDGNITVPQGTALQTAPGGTITLSAANLFVQGSITAPGGSLTLNVFDISPAVFATLLPESPIPAVDPTRGGFVLGPNARLDVSGNVTDLRAGATVTPGASYLPTGGTVTVNSFALDLQRGSVIAADGGLTVSGAGQITYGAGGSIALAAGQDINIPAVFGGVFNGRFNLGATLSGLSGAKGGSLSLLAPFIQVGGQSSHAGTLLLSPDFFSQGGFATFTLSGLGDATAQTDVYLPAVVIAPGTQINPVAQSLLANLDTSGQGSVAVATTTLPEGVRNPVSLNFRAPGVRVPGNVLPVVRGDFVMGEGASIKTDGSALVAAVTISANTAEVLGSIQVPGGTISVAGGSNSVNYFTDSSQALFTVDLGARAVLSTAGEALLIPNALGLRSGPVATLQGGNITLSGNVAARAGSVLDVSGASAVFDLAPGASTEQSNASLNGTTTVPTRVDGNGGSITLTGTQELFVDSTLRGGPGGPSATGGKLTVSSQLFFSSPGTFATPLNPTLEVTPSGNSIPAALAAGPFPLIGGAFGGELVAPGHFAADRFNNSGLASLDLQGSVLFNGPVTLTAPQSLTVGDGGVIFSNVAVALNAPYVSLGTAFHGPFTAQEVTSGSTNAFTVGGQPFYLLQPTGGAASLSVSASLIDVGNLSLQGIGNASLVANGGDIRGDGTLDIAGNLHLTAGQIYPPTETTFTVAVYDYSVNGVVQPGTVTLTGGGTRPLPLSAGGTVNIYGSIINDGGTVRAPIGTINLGSDGTGTPFVDPITNAAGPITFAIQLQTGSVASVSAVDPTTGKALLIPYGVSPDGKSWIDPAGNNLTITGVSAKTVNVAGQIVDDQPGSTIDLRGGGDLYAYEFQSGVGGTVDILGPTNPNFTTSFAVLPGTDLGYAPFVSSTGDGNAGYSNATLAVGDRINLRASNGLAAGTYTLLPARYALLPGALLVTPVSNAPTLSTLEPTGATVVSGYRLDGFDPASAQPLLSSFEVAPASVVRSRAAYTDYSANTFLTQAALDNNEVAPRLPIDSGRLLFDSTRQMSIAGSLAAQAPDGGRGSEVDISSTSDIRVLGPGGTAEAGALNLDAASLSAFGAESLLIGGRRTSGASGTVVSATTANLTVDNAGAPLTGPDVILVANQSITLAPSAVVSQSGTLSTAADPLTIGNAATAGSGNGVLIRVSADPAAAVSRLSVGGGSIVMENIGANALLAGASVTLDSTAATSLDPSASLRAQSLNLNSGQVNIVLDNSSSAPPSLGLVLSGATLGNLSATNSLSLLSYSLIDIYGSGQIAAADTLSLHAAAIERSGGSGEVVFQAKVVNLDNSANVSAPVNGSGNAGAIEFDANTIRLGANPLQIAHFASVTLTATDEIFAGNAPSTSAQSPSQAVPSLFSGSLSVQGDLSMNAPVLTGTTGASYAVAAAGNLRLAALPSTGTAPAASLGANLSFTGSSVSSTANFQLPSGQLSLHATAGDLNVTSGTVGVGGTAQSYFDLTRYTGGGAISLTADNGSITLGAGSSLNVSAAAGGGDGGSLTISTPHGTFTSSGVLAGTGGVGGQSATFSLDVGALPSLTALNAELNGAGFAAGRTFRVRTGDTTVGGVSRSAGFDVAADGGSIDVTGTIDASGTTGGAISLAASGSVTLEAGSLLTVAADQFDAAGKGGSVDLSAGAEINGNIDRTASLNLLAGSKIDASVAANATSSAQAGDFAGTVHLRAPQTIDGTDVQMSPVGATVTGASAVVVEGYALYDLTGDGNITSYVKGFVSTNGATFGNNALQIGTRLFGGNDALRAISLVEPGAEIINRTGNVTLGSTTSDASADWDLSTYRFGPQGTPGVLTLRAAGDLVFFNTLSDGFGSSSSSSASSSNNGSAYNATLLPVNPLLLPSQQSWSYNLTAGADFDAADHGAVVPVNASPTAAGSVLLGKDYGNNVFSPSGARASTSGAVSTRFQVIRTGSGDIDIAASQDVKLLNQFATIYTAGTQGADATLDGTFDLPNTDAAGQISALGAIQQTQPYPAQYSMAGGNVSIRAQDDIVHQTLIGGVPTDDSSHQLPVNWLYRRGYVDPATGQFGVVTRTVGGTDVGSTAWWVDFSNFFEGVATLGGGNVSLSAGHNVTNVDAAAPTNARTPARNASGNALAPGTAAPVELGGGNVTVRAGNNIDGGVYYVERGAGKLDAGGSIVTNATRSPSLGLTVSPSVTLDEHTWLPTTLFLGKGSFDVAARGDVLTGPAANVFLLPEGINNSFWYKTYFSTYDPSDAVNVSSLTGSVSLREGATLPGTSGTTPLLGIWLDQVLRVDVSPQSMQSPSYYQPWLRLDVVSVQAFNTVATVSPGSLFVTAFSGDVNLVGNLTLSPSPTGTVDLIAQKAINGLQPSGLGQAGQNYSETQINLSDADPARIPGVTSPFAFRATLANPISAPQNQPLKEGTSDSFLNSVNAIFQETGSTSGDAAVLQAKQTLHATGPLHANDPDPVHLYAATGDLSGLTLFTGKTARIVSGEDISDIAFYVQNVRPEDTAIIQAGRDLTAYDLNSKLRAEAGPGAGNPASGDIQISGPGTLEVLAGRNLGLGISATANGDTGLGITSIGNGRNPSLPFAGANIIVGAGTGVASGLSGSAVDFAGFIGKFLDPAAGDLPARYLPALGTLLGLGNSDPGQVWSTFRTLSPEQQDQLALQVYYLVLRDAGRDHNNPASPGFGNYTNGEAAVAALFPGTTWRGDITLTSREINTRNGGDISVFAPGGQLDVGVNSSTSNAVDQGILTEDGGNISIFAAGNVNVGTSRVFTLRGGNEIIWSTDGNIAAGSSPKTVLAAPPTRVLVDPQSADIRTDLAGLATGGGIGVLESVAGVPPADIDLIAPTGTIDAGDAGIRVSGNLNLAAVQIINASNISVGGTSAGVPTITAPNLGAIATASNSTAAVNNTTSAIANQTPNAATVQETPSIITAEVVGYGGGESDDDQEEQRKKRPGAPQL